MLVLHNELFINRILCFSWHVTNPANCSATHLISNPGLNQPGALNSYCDAILFKSLRDISPPIGIPS